MKHSIHLNETAIKRALKDGHITQQEARQMLMVYLKKADFTPMRHPSSDIQHSIRANHY